MIFNVRQKLLNNVVKPSHHFYVAMLPVIWRLILRVKNIPNDMHVVVQHLPALLLDYMHLCILLSRDLDPKTVLRGAVPQGLQFLSAIEHCHIDLSCDWHPPIALPQQSHRPLCQC